MFQHEWQIDSEDGQILYLDPTKTVAMSGMLVKVFSRIRHQIRREFSSFMAKSIATASPVKIVKLKAM